MTDHDAEVAAVLAVPLYAHLYGRAAVDDVLAALTAAGYMVIRRRPIEDCDDPWVCCIHERPKDA